MDCAHAHAVQKRAFVVLLRRTLVPSWLTLTPQHPVRLRLHCRHRRSILVPLALATLTSPMAPTFATLRVPPLGSVPSLVAALSCRLVTWVTSVPLVVTLARRPRFCLGVLLLVVACKIGTGGQL